MYSNHSLIICASHSCLEERVRLNKLKFVLNRNQIQYKYWGWDRKSDHPKLNYPIKYLWRGGGFANKSLFLHYPLWIISIFLAALRLKKNNIVYAVSLDVAIPIYLASRIRHFKYIFDNPDNFSLTYNLKGLLKATVDQMESIVAKNALYHILPVESRFIPNHSNILIIPNFPLKNELNKAENLLEKGRLKDIDLHALKTDARLKIYINGWMVKHRGSEWIARVIRKLSVDNFLILVAGDVFCEILSKQLSAMKNVVRFPNLKNFAALALYKCSDIVLAFYDPILPINRKAAPNKWWDCVALKTPFISNEEIETLSTFKNADACLTVPYDNDTELLHLLENLRKRPDLLSTVKQNMQKFEVVSWDKNFDTVISELSRHLS